jgi:hypothetical protein
VIAQLNKLYIKIRPTKIYSRLVSYILFEGRPLTTKGQWINPIIFFLFKIYKKIPFTKKIQKPIFIIGTGRSGSTALGLTLSIHKDIGFLNEPKALWYSVFSNEDLIGSYSNKLAYFKLDKTHTNKEKSNEIKKLYSTFLFITRSKRILDKYPELIYRIPFINEIFPDAKYLFLIRNGYDTCNSINYWSNDLGIETKKEKHDWWGRNNRKWIFFKNQILKKDVFYENLIPFIDEIDNHFEMAVLEWIAAMRNGLELSKLYPNQIKKIYYENLILNPMSEINEILKFCELPHDEKLMAFACNYLKPSKQSKKIVLHPKIQLLFNETMIELGYKI